MQISLRLRTFLFLSVIAISAWAQTFRGSIVGTIVDASGAAVPEVTVIAVNQGTGLTRQAVASAGGDFAMPDLPLGFYNVTVTKTGFGTQKIDGIEVAVSRTSNLAIKLTVAQQATTIEISAAAASIETSSSTLANVVGPRMVQDLPMNGRDFRQMLKLSPGVSPSSGSVNGMRTSGNNSVFENRDSRQLRLFLRSASA